MVFLQAAELHNLMFTCVDVYSLQQTLPRKPSAILQLIVIHE